MRAWVLSIVVTLAVLVVTGCGGGSSNGGGTTPPPPSYPVTLSPASATLWITQTQQFTAMQNGSAVSADWYVNDVQSGNASVGTIDMSGLYTAPSAVPSPASVTVKGCSSADSTKCGTAAVTVTPPPDKIVYMVYTPDNGDELIWSIDPDGTGATELTFPTPPRQVEDMQPDWNKDQTKLAFMSNRTGINAVYTMNADGSIQTEVKNGLNDSQWPSWSPDGTKFAFIGTFNSPGPNATVGLAVMNIDGRGIKQLTSIPCADGCHVPDKTSWSPDGKKIIFGNAGQISVFDLQTGTVTNLSNNNFNEGYPSYSPDSNYISFSSNRGGDGINLFLMTSDGSQVKQLTFGGNRVYSSAWSKDSKQVVFEMMKADAGDQVRIFKMDIDGNTPPTQLTVDQTSQPSWH